MDKESHFHQKYYFILKSSIPIVELRLHIFFTKKQEEKFNKNSKVVFAHSSFKNDGYCKEIIRFVFFFHLMVHLKQSLKSRFILKRKSLESLG